MKDSLSPPAVKWIIGLSAGAAVAFFGWVAKSQYDDGILFSRIVTIQENQSKILADHEVRIRARENARRFGEFDERGPLNGG